jgi:acyl carrier protein phosphodiesterase
MNYLAHLVIGGPDSNLMIGNFMGDAIKGRSYRLLPEEIAEGVLLHRWIDSEADAHPASMASRADLRPVLGRMSGVGLDLLHDYFLARNFQRVLPGWSLESFAESVQSTLHRRRREMPERSQLFLDAMVKNQWLQGYGSRKVMLQVCASMDARLNWESNLRALFDAVDAVDESCLESRFLELMTDLMINRSDKWPSW